MLNISEVATQLRLSVATVRRLCEAGRLTYMQSMPGSPLRFEQAWVNDYKVAHTHGPTATQAKSPRSPKPKPRPIESSFVDPILFQIE